jgi:hypothetical protein
MKSTLSYLLSEIMMRNKLEDCHAFLRDRMRAIRQDYTLQNERGQSAIMVHEIIARFHILSTHLMCEVPGFSLGQEMEQLRKGKSNDKLNPIHMRALIMKYLYTPSSSEFTRILQ